MGGVRGLANGSRHPLSSLPLLPSPLLSSSFSHAPQLLQVKLTRRERRGRPKSILTPGRVEGEVADDDAAEAEGDAEAGEDAADVEASGASGLVSSSSEAWARARTRRVAWGAVVADPGPGWGRGDRHAVGARRGQPWGDRASAATMTVLAGRGRVRRSIVGRGLVCVTVRVYVTRLTSAHGCAVRLREAFSEGEARLVEDATARGSRLEHRRLLKNPPRPAPRLTPPFRYTHAHRPPSLPPSALPRSSRPTMARFALASLALLVGIDRFMSECRALTNLVGNGVATLVIARWEGDLDRQVLKAELDKGPISAAG